MIINDPRNGNAANLDSAYRLLVNSKSSPFQHIISEENQEAYEVDGSTSWAAAAGAQNVLHISNTSTTKNIIITYIRMQAITDLTVPASGTYFTLETGETYSSGGAAVTPVNTNFGSPNTASVTGYDSNPTLTGTSTEVDRYYLESNGKQITMGKEGALIIQPTRTLKIMFTPAGSHTGIAYAHIAFIMEAPGD